MDDQRGDDALARSFFEFVNPAAVVGERLAFEEFRIVGSRLVDEKHRDFSMHVDAFVIVPVVCGGFDSESDENDWRIDVGDFGLCFVVDGEIVEEFEADCIAASGFWDEAELRAWQRFHRNHRHVLEKRTAVAGGFQSIRFELCADVFGGEVSAALAGAAAFEQIARQKFNVGANHLRIWWGNRLRRGMFFCGERRRAVTGKLGCGHNSAQQQQYGKLAFFHEWPRIRARNPCAARASHQKIFTPSSLYFLTRSFSKFFSSAMNSCTSLKSI